LFGHTLGNIGTLFDFSTLIGTVNFQVQANAFEQNGVISIKSRPFSTVLDGLCTTLDVGPSLPIVINSTFGGQGSITFVNAANNLSVTPYVVDDEAGNPIAVTLDLKITANDVDNTTVTNGVPAISQSSRHTAAWT
jgi:type II secretory pathway component GspD/PulD (secretin)